LVEARRRASLAADAGQDGRGLGRIYGANTLGAALAALASVHLIFPALGSSLGAARAAALGRLSAGLARQWPRPQPALTAPTAAAAIVVDTSRDPDPDLLREPWLLSLVSFGTGATGIGLQVVGVRILGQHLENTIFTFAHILAAYLVATSLGALLYQRLSARAVAGRPAGVTAALLWLLALLVVPAALALHYAPEFLTALAPAASAFGRAALAELAVAFLVFAPTAIVLGALLSHVIGLVAATGRGVGRVYAYN